MKKRFGEKKEALKTQNIHVISPHVGSRIEAVCIKKIKWFEYFVSIQNHPVTIGAGYENNIQMKELQKPLTKKPKFIRLKQNIRRSISRIKELQGDPHYIAMGMAIGVFVSLTPTIPFHTVIAIAMAFILRGSKPAAAIGVWFSNPITIPFFYVGSYKTGIFILGHAAPFDAKYESITELLKLGVDITIAMITGGVILGILPGIAAYFITRRLVTAIRSQTQLKSLKKTEES